jgi:N-acetylmuramoyl-L-alanine amidase
VQYKNKVFEKDITLAVALFLRKEIGRREGIQILLTRSQDVSLPVRERIKYANNHYANMLISIHVNGGFGNQASGFEFYVPGLPLKKTDSTKKTLNESIRFAQLLQSEFDRILPRKGRGLREAPLTIFNGLSVPAVIAEIGFITNSGDREILLEQEMKEFLKNAFTKVLDTFH